MPRPPCCRRVEGKPAASIFKPAGIPTHELNEIVMTLDEFEAVRLADLDGLYQEQASEKMGVSRSTFSRIVDAAHRKVADALVHGKALRIEGGPVFDNTAHRRCERRNEGERVGPLPPTKRSSHMNLCIPVTEDRGIKSPVCGHFGSAPLFVIVDTDRGSCRALPNRNLHHGHGMCQPLASFAGEELDAIAVGGIGMGALNKLQAANLRVFITGEATVEETVAAFKGGALREATPATACSHHGHGPHGHEHSGPGPHGNCGALPESGQESVAGRLLVGAVAAQLILQNGVFEPSPCDQKRDR